MATFQQGGNYTAAAGADLTGKRFYIVKLDTNGAVVLASAATDAILGVLNTEGTTGKSVDVVLLNGSGSFKVKTGGDVTKDAYLTTDSSGKAIATTSSGNRVIGRAVAAGTSGDIVEYFKSNEKY